MEINWKYKIDLKDSKVFDEIGEKRGISFPEKLKDFIIEANAATPDKIKFMVGCNEKVFGAVFSFNRDETEADSVFDALPVIEDKNLIPFGIDPFGNFICYSIKDEIVVFWDHETDSVESTELSLDDFLTSLYE